MGNDYEIVKWEQSKYLVMSSMFIFPAAYISYIRHYYMYSYLIFSVVFCSMNYWRKATHGKRRHLDLIVSKICFFVLLYVGIMNLQGIVMVFGYTNLAGMVYCYYTANNLFIYNNNNWLKYHCMFHLLVGLQSYTIMTHLPELENNNKQ
jgi:hypothetical protein